MQKEKKKRPIAAIIILIILAVAVHVYILFFLYIPWFTWFNVDEYEITEKQIAMECPDVMLTDYDREFLDKIFSSTLVQETGSTDSFAEIELTADEAGFERYSPRPDENYMVTIHNRMYGIFPVHASVEFEDGGKLYRRELYMSVNEDNTEADYTKAITIVRSDGKLIAQYWNDNGEYEKTVFKYGIVNYLVSYIEGLIHF